MQGFFIKYMVNLNILSVGELEANCYIISASNSSESIIIDPGADEKKILDNINKNNLDVKYILNTHAHPDHIGGCFFIKEKTKALILLHKDDSKMFKIISGNEPDKFLVDKDIISIGNLEFKVIHTPGHTKGSICVVLEKIIFTGDTLFAGGIGRTDFPGGSYNEIISSIKNRLLILDDDYKIYPGHGGSSTIGYEKKYNQFLS